MAIKLLARGIKMATLHVSSSSRRNNSKRRRILAVTCQGGQNSCPRISRASCYQLHKQLIEHHKEFPGVDYVMGKSPENAVRRVSHRLSVESEAKCSRAFNFHSLRYFFFAQWFALGGTVSSFSAITGLSFRGTIRSVGVVDRSRHLEMASAVQESIEKSVIA